MALFDAYNKKSILKAAVKQTEKARENQGAKADQLFISAYEGFADVIKDDLVRGEALNNWGFALLHQAKEKDEVEAVKLYLEAISKFTFCLLVQPNHLGAAIDGGVAYMDLARIMGVGGEDELYDLALEFFDNSERIQRGSAAYNLACIAGLRGEDTACQEALELSRECGSLPKIEDIKADVDLAKVSQTQWFIDFVEKVSAVPEPVVADKDEISFDVEGNEVNKNKKKKQYENEVDGVVYDAEGNVIRSDHDMDQENVETESVSADSESIEAQKPKEKTFMSVGLNK